MYLFTFIFNVLFYGFRDLFKRERWKLRRHDLGSWRTYTCDVCTAKDCAYSRRVFIPYMLRWVIQTPFGGIRLQKICSSDKERHLHDHPFDFVTFRLCGGGYIEETPDFKTFINLKEWVAFGMKVRSTMYSTFSVGFRKATDLHRLTLLAHHKGETLVESPQWTLFFHGPNLREWGFQTETGWEQWQVYEKRFGIYEANNPGETRLHPDPTGGPTGDS